MPTFSYSYGPDRSHWTEKDYMRENRRIRKIYRKFRKRAAVKKGGTE